MDPKKIYELVIIGAGPAGLSASIYASRYGIDHLISGSLAGGVISETHLIDNYPGIEDAAGFDFSQKLVHHAKKYGVEMVVNNVEEIIKKENIFESRLSAGEKIKSKTILIATGNKRRKLNIPSEAKFIGKGVSYCATCDGFFYKTKVVAVVGGNDSALGAALYLANLASKVYIIYRKSAFRAEPYWIKKVKENKKIESIFDSNIEAFFGKNKMEKISIIKNNKESQEIKLDGVFIEIGSEPDLGFAKNLEINTDKTGAIKVKRDGSAGEVGVWAAGDITDGSDNFRQVITAAAEGAIAARSIYKFLKK